MTLSEKVAFIGLQPIPTHLIEEANPGVQRLCIPRLILRDGPVGVAYGAKGVTAFPSELNLAATFDPKLAASYGTWLGREAHGQGQMGIQGPGLNVSVFDNWGRGFENLGEDPVLTSVLGADLVGGIQSTGTFAMAKHLSVYTQETARPTVDAIVSPRAQEEIFLAPFRAAVRAGVSSIMCAMGEVDGVESCSDAAAIAEMHRTGFRGFVRTDAYASTNEVAAIKAGVDLFRPYDPAPIRAALNDKALPFAVLNRAVREVLTVMLRYGDVGHPFAPNAGRKVTTPGSVATSLGVAEESMVLLKDNGVLPLGPHPKGSIAVIGAAAASSPIVAGGGSSKVRDGALTSDLTGIEQLALPSAVSYTPANSAVGTTTLQFGTASADPSVPGFQRASLTLPPSMTGLVDFTYSSATSTRLAIDGSPLLQNSTTSARGAVTFEKAVGLGWGTHYVDLVWPDGRTAPTVTAQPVNPLIEQAVAAAKSASTVVMVVGERDSEGVDRSSLALPGYQDQLIEAVAAANPRTVVVVHSGGPVLMPWLDSVAAVLEAWYPGQVAGTALAAVLSGAVNPSGRLPVAFPTSDGAGPMIPSQPWPTPASTANLVGLGDLGVGSRWYAAHGVTPLFRFGFGLSYTTFSVDSVTANAAHGAINVRVRVSNTGPRIGRDVALVDVTYPGGSGEPANELKAFGSVTLKAHRSTTLTLAIPIASLDIWQGRMRHLSGTYTVSVDGHSTSILLG